MEVNNIPIARTMVKYNAKSDYSSTAVYVIADLQDRVLMPLMWRNEYAKRKLRPCRF